MMNRTKIVATVGPASRTPEVLRNLIDAGVDVFRLNFSHGTHETHAEVIANLRDLSHRLGKPLALLQDLSGPKVRLGDFPAPVMLKRGQEVAFADSGGTSTQPPPSQGGEYALVNYRDPKRHVAEHRIRPTHVPSTFQRLREA